MNQLAKMLEQLRKNTSDYEMTQRVLTQAIIQVLQSQRILGEILLQVPRCSGTRCNFGSLLAERSD